MRHLLTFWHLLLALLLAAALSGGAPLGVLAAPSRPPGDATLLAAQNDTDDDDDGGDDGDDDDGDDDDDVEPAPPPADDDDNEPAPPPADDGGDDDDDDAPVVPSTDDSDDGDDNGGGVDLPSEEPVAPSDDDDDDDDDVESIDEPRSNQAIVRLEPEAEPFAFASRYGIAVLRTIPDRNIHLVQLNPDRDDAKEVDELDADDDSVWAELNFTSEAPEGRPRYFFTTGNHSAPLAEDQSPPAELNLEAASCATGEGVIVAVLDTGIDAGHPDLTEQVLPGYNAVLDNEETNDAGNGEDDDGDGVVDEMTGHGTHVAGIIAEVAPGADLLPVTVLNSDGVGDAFYVAAGIYYAIDEGTEVINLSLGSTHDSRVIEEATGYAADERVLVVSAAGNADREEPAEYPATYSDALSVAATAPGDVKAAFSNYHPRVDLSAPGTDIVSTFPDETYVAWSGTSMAAPFVSGAAALIVEERGDPTLGELRDALTETTAPIEVTDARWEGKLGSGRLDIGASVACED